MNTILVVKRPFKSRGKYYPVGAIIKDPTTVKLLRIKVNEGKIVQLHAGQQDLDGIIAYLEARANRKLRVGILQALGVAPSKPAAAPSKPPVPQSKPRQPELRQGRSR